MIALGSYYFIVFRGVWFRGVGIFFGTDNRLYFKKECHGNKIIVVFSQSQDEIFDMVKPTDPYRISLQDLVNRSVNLMLYF